MGCNACGKNLPMKYCGVLAKWKVEDGEADFSVFACSDECKKMLLENPNALLFMLQDFFKEIGLEFNAEKFINENGTFV